MKVDKKIRPYVRAGRFHACLSGLNASFAVILGLVLFVMVNYLSYRHYVRVDVSRNQFYALSDKSINVLDAVTNVIHVTVFLQPNEAVYRDVRHLLDEYQYACSGLKIEWVDPDRDLARMEALMKQYKLEEPNVVVFDNNGRGKYVTVADIADYDYEPLKAGQPAIQTAFNGERVFSSAIQAITQQRKPVVYFLQGHGEGDPEDTDERRGFSKIAREIERDNVEVRTMLFGRELQIPPDCDVLIIAGPTKDYSITELDEIRRYLEHNGRLFIMLDARQNSALDMMLEDWGVVLADDLVVDPSRTLTGRGDLFVTEYLTHPLTENLKNITSVFYLPRSVRPLEFDETEDMMDRPRVNVLAASSVNGWAETDLDDAQARFDAGADTAGPIPIAVAIEKGAVPGINVQIRPTRVLVVGDSDFVANKGIIGGNIDFFLSGLNWLLEREELMTIAPKPITLSKLLISRKQQMSIFWVVVAGMPGVVALLGFFVWLRRRS